jgi:hypothetical protein
MHKLFRTLALVMTAMLVSYVVGCGGGETTPETPPPGVITGVDPAEGSSVPANATISITFDNPVESVETAGAEGSGKSWTVPVVASLNVTWTNRDGTTGSQTLTYTLVAPDTTAPQITGGTVTNGAKDVEPGPLNADKIQITFDEDVTGTAELNFEDNTSAGWQGAVTGMNAELTPVAGKELANSVTYVIVLSVSDAAGNKADFKVEFTTKAKE